MDCSIRLILPGVCFIIRSKSHLGLGGGSLLGDMIYSPGRSSKRTRRGGSLGPSLAENLPESTKPTILHRSFPPECRSIAVSVLTQSSVLVGRRPVGWVLPFCFCGDKIKQRLPRASFIIGLRGWVMCVLHHVSSRSRCGGSWEGHNRRAADEWPWAKLTESVAALALAGRV